MTENLTIPIEKDLLEELKSLAQARGKSVSLLAKEALKDWITQQQKRKKGEELLRLVREKPRVKDKAFFDLEEIRKEWR